MRNHGWQLPYHPLQVVAVAVFLALGFAYYVFFAPFVGKKLFQYIAIGIYTPLIVSAFGLYIWCAGSDPADPGVFKSKKYLKNIDKNNHASLKETKLNGESASTIQDGDAKTAAEKKFEKSSKGGSNLGDFTSNRGCFSRLLALLPCTLLCHCTNSAEASELSEDGMFYCSLCEVEVYKFSKHCRVCDKCVDQFDHHCRWLNNCIGKRNYRKFFTLMVSAILLLILQWSTGILVLVCCFLERKRFSVDIASKLGSSFTLVPFVIVVAVCTILAMIATLPLAQLFFFHILLIKKGISTYDYIIALREQEQQGIGVQQSPQMSPGSSLTGLSSASSFNTFQRAAWCTPPRLFVEDQFDVVPPETGSVSSLGKKTTMEEPIKNHPAVKISPWTLARLNAEEVSKTAAEARKRSKILQPVATRQAPHPLERESSFSSSSRRMNMRPDNDRKRPSKRIRLPADLPFEPRTNTSSLSAVNRRDHMSSNTSSRMIPLELEARSAFGSNPAISTVTGVVASSPESSLDSTDIHPFRISSSGAEEGRRLVGLLSANFNLAELPLSRSTSGGYDASGGEDSHSDRVPNRIVQRSTNWSSLLFGSEHKEKATKLKSSTSTGQTSNRKS